MRLILGDPFRRCGDKLKALGPRAGHKLVVCPMSCKVSHCMHLGNAVDIGNKALVN